MSIPKSRVKFTIKCTKLVNKDTLSKSDPMVIVNVKNGNNTEYEYVGQTEWVRNNLNPTFQHRIEMDYTFETKQMLRFTVIDVDDPHKVPDKYIPNSAEGDLLGHGEVLMSKLMGSRKQCAEIKLTAQKPNKDYGTITIMAEQLADDARPDDCLVMHMFGRDLARKDGPLAKSDPFLVFEKTTLTGQKEEIFKTEVIKQDLNPSWKPMRMNLLKLCGGHFDTQFTIHCYDWDRMSSNDLIGSVQCSVSDLLSHKDLKLIDPKKPAKDVGSLQADKASVLRLPSFLDYLTEGIDISLTAGIDFTLSNGESKDATSLHYADPSGAWNAYQLGLIGVGDVLQPYAKDGVVSVFGYGGIPDGSTTASFCFPIGPRGSSSVEGVQGLLDAYASGLKTTKLYGPTNMAPLILKANMLAKETQRRVYHVLMIMTDGEISDMIQTVDAIVESSFLPMSIVIVGVGNKDHPMEFENMTTLDGDKAGLVDSNCRKAARDIVQFVPFMHGGGSSDTAELAKQVLHEIPKQLVQYYVSKGEKPKAWEGTPYDMLPIAEALHAMHV
eukprot:CAMPEP_0173381032 /NCGR_PEP_ID=MMETSP1356-20130122/3539_1 /TAXON_ID=77927 ORGANISM="Hemiselmis virescens, Strain PCC157" /NCGR_SAMPLE_ID=MMETSP1356 /ASSEMBLY_ACC=CAM_ASM_000847 /LENGTH=552 /DNA_ID=CAMNT_0014334769 /DNA_START=39 /DNA_END=1697 /DNA_ORIENTATION=+